MVLVHTETQQNEDVYHHINVSSLSQLK